MHIYYRKKLTRFISLVLSTVIFLIGCGTSKTSSSTSEPLTRQNFVLGTIVSISLYDHQSEETLDAAFKKLSELENILSVNKTNTLIDEINAKAGIEPVKVDEATYNLIKKGIYYSQLTSGAFDVTVGPIVKLWNIGFPNARVPSQTEIDEKLPLVDYNFVTLDDSNQTVYLQKKGMLLDLGGIGKGYAADEVADLLRKAGVEHAIINLGGNIYALGDKPVGKPWGIGIQDPFNPRGATIGTLGVTNKSVVTSGIYERYLEAEDGTKYHHILNPDTGYPYTNEIAGVTIVSDSSTDGDALSTSTFALGIEEGLKFIEGLDGIDAIFITTDKKVYITSGIKENFKITNTAFEQIN